jgi:purine-binding chemotaxis protein CheW
MEHARDGNTARNTFGGPYLICRSDTRLCALPLASVAETMRPLPLEPLAAMPAFVLGVSVIRGAPVPVVDAAALLGTGTSVSPQRVVTLKVGERHVGLAVDGVIGVHVIPAATLDDVPPLLRETDDVVSAISTLDSRLLLVLQGACIVPDTVWAAIAPDAAPS